MPNSVAKVGNQPFGLETRDSRLGGVHLNEIEDGNQRVASFVKRHPAESLPEQDSLTHEIEMTDGGDLRQPLFVAVDPAPQCLGKPLILASVDSSGGVQVA